MAIMHDDMDKVLSVLTRTEPMPEEELRVRMARLGVEDARLEIAVNNLQHMNKIRWVAFSGWCLGGRP